MTVLEELLERIQGMDEKKLAELQKEVNADPIAGGLWVPNPGAQTTAFFSDADELGFGGEAGPGKTDLIIGLSLTHHKRSLILRRTNKEARKLSERYQEILGHRNGLNTGEGIWRLPNNRIIDYGGVEHEEDKQKFKGSPHDLIAFDEVVDFTKSQFEFIKQWNRTRDRKQRCRVVATFNPPTRPVGMWVIPYWGPWLDPKHPDPAEYGELRWFTTIDGEDTEVDGPGPHLIDGEKIMARSRTFIRGHLEENVHIQGYDAVRAAAPKELRSAYRAGDFEASLADVPGQLIPSVWIRQAQDRWTPGIPDGIPMCAMGVDASGGGDDPMTIAPRHDGWYAEIIEVPGRELDVERMGAMCAGIIISHRRDQATVIIDLGGGYGGPTYERLLENGIQAQGYKGAEKATRRTADRKHGFANMRSATYWAFREALDPDQPNGSPIALPPGQKLFADLATPTFEIGTHGITLEKKESVKERIGRSPDHGDAVVMAWSGGSSALTHGGLWREMKKTFNRPKVIRSHENRKRRWR